jgi:hypothetical protein
LPIKLPPSDKNGLVIPHDHDEILDDHRIIRGVSAEFVVKDEQGRPQRLSSAALDPSTVEVDPYCGLSVDIEQLMIEQGVTPEAHVQTGKFVGSIAFKVRSFRSRDFLVGYDPFPKNPCHGAVWQDATRNSKLTRGTRKALLQEAAWSIPIDGIPITI